MLFGRIIPPKWLRGGGSQSFVSERRREEFSCRNERNKKIIYVLQVDLRLIAMVTGHVPRHLPSRLSPSFFPRLPQEDDTGSFCVSPPLPENSLVWMLNNHKVTDLHPPTTTSHPLNNCLLFIASCPSPAVLLSFSPAFGENKQRS